MIDVEQPQKLGPNVSSFERHIAVGLETAGLNIEDFFPVYMSHTEDKSKGVGFGIMQLKADESSYVCCFESGLEFPDGGSSVIINDDQPASMVAVLVLVSILSGRPICGPECPHCQEESI